MTIWIRPRVALVFTMFLVAALGVAIRPAAAQLVPGPAEGYLIITTSALASEFQLFAEWKRRLGLPTTVKTIEALRSEYPAAADDAERMRLWIRDQYTGPGARWVLLGGTAALVPTRYATTQFFGGALIPTDLYFSCLDGSWNADGDALWGEGYASASDPGDDADLLPEVWVGRAPVTNAAEVRAFVVRSIQASLEPAHPRPPRALLAAEVLFPQVWSQGDPVSLDGAQLAEELLPRLNAGGFATRRLYENFSDPQWTAGSEPLGRQAFLDAFDAGNDLVLVFDSETQTELGMGGSDVVSVSDIEALTNTLPLSHVYLWGGLGPCGPDSPIGPAFFHSPGGSPSGAATVVGLTQFAFPTALRAYADEYFRLLIDDDVRALGETLGRSRLPFVQFSVYDGVNRWTQMALTMFGDPQLSLPRRAAHDLALAAPATVDVGVGGVPVHVTEDGVAKPGVVVTAYRAAEGIATATTDAQGDALVPFSASASGEISLTARQPGSPVEVDSVDAVTPTGVPAPPGVTRFAFALPRPNPSSGDVLFRWSVPADLADARSRLVLHDLAGRIVRTWDAGAGAASARSMTWDGRDAMGGSSPPGLYVARLVVGDRVLTRLVVRTR
ncbi:MAG TPA: C25 family cysteine peptidase [Candidatus Eisenbacteria bacterium]|jgi:hypothetical protein